MKRFIHGIMLAIAMVLVSGMFVYAADGEINISENDVIDEKENCVGVDGKERPDVESGEIQTLAVSGQWIQSSDGHWWYKHNDNTYTKNGWELINGSWYYFDSQGWMVTGWIKVGIDWYYLSSSGAMVTGWNVINGKWYYFNGSGVMLTNWVLLKGKWYYLGASGAMQTGWVPGKNRYYYCGSDGAQVAESTISKNVEKRSIFVSSSGETASVTVTCYATEVKVPCENNQFGYPYRTAVVTKKTAYAYTSGEPSVRVATVKHVNGSSAGGTVINNFPFGSKNWKNYDTIVSGKKVMSNYNTTIIKYGKTQTRSLVINWFVSGNGGYMQSGYTGALVMKLQ